MDRLRWRIATIIAWSSTERAKDQVSAVFFWMFAAFFVFNVFWMPDKTETLWSLLLATLCAIGGFVLWAKPYPPRNLPQ